MILKIKGQDEPKPEKELMLWLEKSKDSGRVGVYASSGGGSFCVIDFRTNGTVFLPRAVSPNTGLNLDSDGRLIIE